MPPKRTRDGSDSEASFTDDDDVDVDDEPAPDLSDGDEAEDNPSRRRSVAERLKRLQTSFPHDRDRTPPREATKLGLILNRCHPAA